MKITFWGTRGSIPTPSQEMLRYGGNTTCVEVRLNDGTLIVIDAGSGLKNLGKKIIQDQDLSELYLFLTHAHWDHLIGFPFFVPAYMKKYKIYVRGGPKAKRFLSDYLTQQMEAPYFPVDFKAMKARFKFRNGNPERQIIGSAELYPIPLSHPNGGYGLKIMDGKSTFIFLTDNELGYFHKGGLDQQEYIEICKKSDLLVHDAQYNEAEYKTKKTWGHSTYNQVLILGISSRSKKIGFFHHDPERTDTALDKEMERVSSTAEQEGGKISCVGIREGMEIALN